MLGAKPFGANQNVRYECFHCAIQIPHIFVGSVTNRMQLHCFISVDLYQAEPQGIDFNTSMAT